MVSILKEDFERIVKYWALTEESHYSKAHHLVEHLNEWMEEHGSWPIDANNAPILMRLLDASSRHVPKRENIT